MADFRDSSHKACMSKLEDAAEQVTSVFGLESENATLKEQNLRLRMRLKRQRRELKRLNKGYTLLLHTHILLTKSPDLSATGEAHEDTHDKLDY